MSKQRIRWIVALMAVGLLGLVSLQLYWISSALRLQKEQFAYKVTDALQEVVRTLERQEIVYLTKQRIQAREQQERLLAIAKKKALAQQKSAGPRTTATASNAMAHKKSTTRPNNTFPASQPTAPAVTAPAATAPAGAMVVESDVLQPTVHPLSAEQMMVVEEFFRQQNELMAVGDWQAQLAQQQQFDHWVGQVLTIELNHLNQQAAQSARRPDSPKTAKHRSRRAAQPRRVRRMNTDREQAPEMAVTSRPAALSESRAEEQSHLIKDVLKGLLLPDRPVEDRINRLALDTLLRQTLAERGISIPFAYGVRTRQQPTFLFTSRGVEPAALNDGGYKAALFPNNLLDTGNYLYVYFPTQQQFILSRLGFTFGASVLLILIILTCFYIAISTIVRQKKLADIKNDFINNMTHEFKTPISTISLAVEMAQEQLRPTAYAVAPAVVVGNASSTAEPDRRAEPSDRDPRLVRYMGIIRDETRRLGSHVEKVLQMALLDRGEIKLKLSPVNVHDVIDKVLNNIGLQIEQREGEVDMEFDADQEIIEADEVHLTNILYNLLDNAIKYSPDRPHITLRTRSLPEGISIAVTDQGLGMTKDQLGRIFEKFYRVPTGNRHDVKGFGLGLSYVKKMVDEHHGQVRVTSQPSRGSTFEIILPYKMTETGD